MLRTRTATATATFLALVSAAFAGSAGAQAAPPTLQLSGSDALMPGITAVVGQRIVIRLPGDGGADSGWTVAKIEGDAVVRDGERDFLANQDKVENVSKGGKYTGTFYLNLKAAKPGKAVVQASFKAPGVPAGTTLSWTVEVKAAGEVARLAAERAATLKADKTRFKLLIGYRGPHDRMSTFYSATFSTLQIATFRHDPYHPMVRISEAQADKVIDHLTDTLWLGLARDASLPTPRVLLLEQWTSSPSYIVSVSGNDAGFSAPLGWGPDAGLVDGLVALRKAFDDAPGAALDRIIKRLQSLAKPGPQGVSGRVRKITGNMMPGIVPDLPDAGRIRGDTPFIGGNMARTQLLSVPVHVFKGKVRAANHTELANIMPAGHPQFVKTVQSGQDGRYMVALEPGEYTVVAEIDGKLYLNSFRGDRTGAWWSTVTVKTGNWTTVQNIDDTSGAAF